MKPFGEKTTMLTQLLLGGLIVIATVILSAAMIWLSSYWLTHFGPWLARPPLALKSIFTISVVSLWFITAMFLSIWIWAFFFLAAGIFQEMEPALYFASVAFTTLGFGDVLLPDEWRLLAGVSAANGLLLFGLLAAYLFELFQRLRGLHMDS